VLKTKFATVYQKIVKNLKQSGTYNRPDLQ
jgi:hypothetical protein